MLDAVVLGSYRTVRLLGEGGMGAVYLAEHAMIGTQVAIKVLHPELCTSQEIVARFFNEARSTALINHPGLVQVFDFGHDQRGAAYLVMELLQGESLASRIRRERALPFDVAFSVLRQLAAAVDAAHARGIVHRDLKPDNIILVDEPEMPARVRVKVLDFGIAKLAGETSAATKTRTGSVMGTPLYMSPEQCRGAGQVDRRADIYSIGCIFFEMLCGRPPFEGEGPGDVMAAHLREPPPSPRSFRSDVPVHVERLITSMLVKRPEERIQTLADVVAMLDEARAATNPAINVAPRPSHDVVAPSTPTTLSNAASEVRVYASSPKRRPIVVGGILAATSIAVAVTVAFMQSGDKSATDRPSQPIVPTSAAVVQSASPSADERAATSPLSVQPQVPIAAALDAGVATPAEAPKVTRKTKVESAPAKPRRATSVDEDRKPVAPTKINDGTLDPFAK